MRTLIVALCCVLSVPPAFSETESQIESAEIPSLISCLRNIGPQNFCGENVPIDDPDVLEALEKEILLAVWDRAQVILWLKRSGRHFPYIEKMLKKYDLPDDLKYVAVIESALRPHVRSPKGAMGFWQFIKPTGLKYGLRIDSRIDERRNIFSATRAAVKYFKKLYGDFGSWTLAAAAYNMGEYGLKNNMANQKTTDFYNTYLNLETRRYLLKMIAVKMIFENPKKYGFHLEKEDYYSPVKVDRISLTCEEDTPVLSIAEAAGTTYKTIKYLNPEIRGSDLVKGTHSILIPVGASGWFQARFEQIGKQQNINAKQAKAKNRIDYVVREGDSLSIIADRHRIPLSSLLKWNNKSLSKPIYPGETLVIYNAEKEK